MNKKIQYKGYDFNIKVTLNAQMERNFNSVPKHEVIINDMGASNFYVKKMVTSSELLETIESLEKSAKRYVDEKTSSVLTKEQELLINLGFTE